MQRVVPILLGLTIAGCGQNPPKFPTLTLVPLGAVPPRNVEAVRGALARTFRMDVRIAAARPLPRSAFYPPRGRYRADSLTEWLAKRSTGDKVLGLTSADISTGAHGVRDWGVAGLAEADGRAAVVSSFRTKGSLARLEDIAAHEVGHLLGLPHCPTPGCTMQDAKGKLARIGGGFCPSCRRRIAAWLRPQSRTTPR